MAVSKGWTLPAADFRLHAAARMDGDRFNAPFVGETLRNE